MNGTWTRRCHRCDSFFQSKTRHGQVCPRCSEKTYRKMLKKKRPVVNARRIFQERVKKIKKLAVLLA